ncbi:sensor histidine kinase [Nonomuraea typhae]|uniref:sensor histidine kinase n=1 Tax=Nonomuraea typhae TaxID=2603600 RepID=UPI0012FC8FB6|nr:sensor histidine kinase [Nonomuraea typhae]
MTGRLDRWERLLERQLAAAPYVLLVISTVLVLLTGGNPWITLSLAAVAAGWLTWMPRRAGYVTGLVVLIGALAAQGMWFVSFFGFVGYLHSWQYLKGPWRFAGVTATAAISVTVYSGGLPEPTPSAILTHLFFTGAIVAAVGLFSFLGEVTTERSAERKRMVAQLEETMRENAGLHAQLLVQAREAGVLDERQRMAAEIHDTLAQGLTGIITQLQAARQGDDWRRHVDLAVRLARESLAEARRSVHAVGPGQLEAAPLPEALQDLVDRWRELNEVRAEFTVTGTVRPMHPEVEETLLRTAQEALANAAKHAHASRVGLTLSYMEDTVTLDVRDDGIGFDPKLTAFGLTAMRKRVSRLAGTLEIESETGAGTAISASLPAVARG